MPPMAVISPKTPALSLVPIIMNRPPATVKKKLAVRRDETKKPLIKKY
jgi:hypothetical protein